MFRKWAIAHGWKAGLMLDRKSNRGDYRPGNCRFVTRAESNRNRDYVISSQDAAKMSSLYSRGFSYSAIAVIFGFNDTSVRKAIARTTHN